MTAVFSHEAVQAILRDRRFGREIPVEHRKAVPPHLAPFYAIEDNSMLELDAPRHTRLRRLVLKAFTTRAISALAPGIEALCHSLIDEFSGEVELITAYAQPIPVITIARLLGVPEEMAPQLLAWSNAMVAMYQAKRDRAIEDKAAAASADFATFLRGYVAERRARPADDLISELIAAEDEAGALSTEELIATCILLLNAGHEATVHSIGNAIPILLASTEREAWLSPERIDGTVEELLRYDPPLHVFTRYALEDVELYGHSFQRGEQVALMLASANRDPAGWNAPNRFDPSRKPQTNASFGGGVHFCVGAPLARLEMRIALRVLFERRPELALLAPPVYGDLYHFHGLESLPVRIRAEAPSSI
ncbi:cytochrome P450 [Poseidonocella pacifica]